MKTSSIHSLSILTLCHSFTNNTTRRSFMLKAAANFLSTNKGALAASDKQGSICLGFTGDVMLGRGIDAILPFHVDGTLYESYMRHAIGYVNLAIKENGPLPQNEIKECGSNYIWGDLIGTFKSIPDMMIVNLETTLTTSNDYAKGKGINYRAHPSNVESLRAFGENSIVTLANNHVLDWGDSGLKETIMTLDEAQIKHAGAGYTIDDAMKPATSTINNKQIAVVAVGLPSAGVPMQWSANKKKSGVYVKEHESLSTAEDIMKAFNEYADSDSIKIVSIHMGPNWNAAVPINWRNFTHSLIDHGADVVVAHSSHHVKGIEVYKNKFISYGLGDFLNDYEGITGQGYEAYRQDLTCLYLPNLNLNGELQSIDIIPCQIKHLKVQRAKNHEDIIWIRNAFNREGAKLGTVCEEVKDPQGNINLRIRWTNN